MYANIGDAVFICRNCNAAMWYEERIEKHAHSANPKFHLCCGNGKVQLPLLKDPPIVYRSYYLNQIQMNTKIISKISKHIV